MKFPLPFRLLCFIWLLSYGEMYAQECNRELFVEVIDLHDGQPLQGARIELLESKRSLVTSDSGMVVFLEVCKGPQTLLIEHPDCMPVTQRVRIQKNNYVKIKLEHHINELQEIIVAEQKVRKGSPTAAERVLKTVEINSYQSASLGDVLEGVSGISNIRTGHHIAKPVLDGMSGSRLGIVQDGTRIRDQEWGSDHAPSIDAASTDRIRIVKGGAALRYGGDTAAGVILMERLPVPLMDSLYGNFSTDFQSNGRGLSSVGKLQIAKSKGSYGGFQFHIKRRGDLEAPGHELSNTGTEKRAFNLHWGFQNINRQFEIRYRYLDENLGILRAAHIGNVSDLVRALRSPTPLYTAPFSYDINAPKQSNRHHQAHLRYHFYDAQENRWQWDYDFQQNTRREYDVRRNSEDKRPSIDMDLTTHSLLGHFRRKAADLQWECGVAGSFQRNFSNPTTGVKRLIPDYYQTTLGGYANATYRPSSQWVWEAGIRYDYHFLDVKKYFKNRRWQALGYDNRFADLVIRDSGTQVLIQNLLHFHMLSFTTGAQVDLSSNWRLGINYALSDRPPNPGELFSDGLHHSLAIIQYGDMELTNERMHKLHLNLQQRSSNFDWEVEAYGGYSGSYILEEPQGLETTTRGAFPAWQYRAVTARLWGLDADATWQFHPQIQWSSQAATVVGENRSDNTPLIDIPPFNFKQKLQWTTKNSRTLSLALQHEFVDKQTRAPELITPYNIIQNGEIVYGSIDLGAPEEAYHLFGFSLTWNTQLWGLQSSWILQGQNVFNRTHRNYLNRMRYFSAEMGQNYQLQIRFEF